MFDLQVLRQMQDVLGLSTESSSSSNNVYIGGGFGSRNSATAVRFYTASTTTTLTGTERMRITSEGQLLINATSSGYGANNYGYNLGVRGTASQAFISICKSNQTLDTQGIIVGLDNNNAYFISRDNKPIDFYNNNTFKMRIATNGNVGIGTTLPQSKLQVAGGIQMADDTDTASATKVGTM